MTLGRVLMGLALVVAPLGIVVGLALDDLFLEIMLLFVALILFELGRSRMPSGR